MRIRLFVLPLVIALLAACAQTADTDGAGSGPPDGGDDPVASDPIRPVGGDLRLGETWYLAATSLSSVQIPNRVTVTFDATTMGGQAPVNSYSAEYTASTEGDLEIGEIASTLMAGSEEDMATEADFFALLATVDGYTAVGAGELYLFDDEMEVLAFSASKAADPTEVPKKVSALAAAVVGMEEELAQATVEDAGLTWRVVSRDGQAFPITEDYSTQRINATIVGATVTETTVG